MSTPVTVNTPDINRWPDVGKIVVFVSIIAILIYYAIVGLNDKSKKSPSQSNDRVVERIVDAVQPESVNPDLHVLKAGETLEGLFIKGRKLTVLPNDSDMVFSLFDINKQLIRKEKKLGNWAEYDPYFVSFKTEKQDKKWIVERW
ncbi:MAG: hypothetical protein Q7R72_02090 [bacterium]|nr:hypothetical protein [bacterium]